MFLLSQEQQELKNRVRDFVDREILPYAGEATAAAELPRVLLERVMTSGFCGLAFPKELGGAGYGALEGLMLIEELSRALASLGYIYTATLFQVCYALKDAVTEQQKEEWLIPAVQGKKLLTLALTEEMGGSDAFAVNTYAEQDGDEWVLNGSKYWITNAGIADGYIVAARTSLSTRSRDVVLFYVDATLPGVIANDRIPTVGLACSPTGCIQFKNCRIPATSMIGENGTGISGHRLMKHALNTGRISLSAIAIGLAQGALEAAAAYTRRREYYGRSISVHQGVSFPIAEISTEVAIARNMLYHVADLLDTGRSVSVEGAQLKLYSTNMCIKACQAAAELHGAIGFDQRFDMSRMLQDSLTLTTAEGTSQVCKMIISNAVYSGKTQG